jgi:hypothetical protein
MEEFCRRCGRPYNEHHGISVDVNEATDYIFDRLLENGIIVDRLDIVELIHLFDEYVETLL